MIELNTLHLKTINRVLKRTRTHGTRDYGPPKCSSLPLFSPERPLAKWLRQIFVSKLFNYRHKKTFDCLSPGKGEGRETWAEDFPLFVFKSDFEGWINKEVSQLTLGLVLVRASGSIGSIWSIGSSGNGGSTKSLLCCISKANKLSR